MTELELRNKVVSTAKAYYGCRESDGSHRGIIDCYNSHTPLAQGYQMKYTDPWCAAFVSAVAIVCGLTDIIPTECSCPRQIKRLMALGAWQESDGYRPSPGDIIYYDWDDSGTGDNTGSADHVGIVTAVSGSSIGVIEGNLNNAVGNRTLAINGRYIRGYGVPNYKSAATETQEAPTGTQTTKEEVFEMAKTYQNGSTSEPVYADSALKTKIGSLNPYETCPCLGTVDGKYLVYYPVDGTSYYKTGFVKYAGVQG